jgi:hypothetical protein
MKTRSNAHALNTSVLAIMVGLVLAPVESALAQKKSASFPQTILIIRHAEKPPRDESFHLSSTGAERAEKLPQLFRTSNDRPAPFPVPDFIFAARDSKHSHRSLETVTPLARSLKLAVDSNYADADFSKLAEKILNGREYAGKTILISWHHEMAPDLAHKLGAQHAPNHWKSEVFDRVWELTYNKNGKVTFRDLPQRLLSSDSEK